MTEPEEGTVAAALRERRSRITKSRTVRRPAPARKATSRPAGRPAGKAEPKVTPGQAIAGGVSAVAGMFAGRAPVHVAIMQRQSVELGPIIDDLAAEDERVRAFIEKIAGWFSSGGAYSRAGTWALATGGALALASGIEHPLLTMLVGSIVQQSTLDAAVRIAQAEALSLNQIDEEGSPVVDPARVAFIVEALSAPRRPPEEESAAVPD
jgi:hypothetical protein